MADEVNIVRRLCDPLRTSIDVGANDGDYALFMAKYSRNLYCFEPVAEMCEALSRRLRGCQTTVECCALGSQQGEGELGVPHARRGPLFTRSTLVPNGQDYEVRRGSTVRKRRVSVRMLDDFRLSSVGFVKIDVEGFEEEVLRGGLDTIGRSRPNLYVEIEQRFHPDRPVEAIIEWVVSLGYRAYFVQGSHLVDASLFDHRFQAHPDTPDYVSNFVFVPI